MYTFVQTLAHLYIFVYNRYVREINKGEKMVRTIDMWIYRNITMGPAALVVAFAIQLTLCALLGRVA